MKPNVCPDPRVLAIDPFTQGFGYAVLENLCTLVYYGVADTRTDKARRGLLRVRQLIQRYQPDVVVIEDCNASGRCQRVRRFLGSVEAYANRRGIPIKVISWVAVYEVFDRCHAETRHDIALTIVRLFQHLKDWLPEKPITWRSLAPRNHVFDAIALAVAFLCRNQR